MLGSDRVPAGSTLDIERLGLDCSSILTAFDMLQKLREDGARENIHKVHYRAKARSSFDSLPDVYLHQRIVVDRGRVSSFENENEKGV
jgi:hypothetical protein